MKPRRFFYHFRKMDGRMSVHFDGQCIPVKNVRCNVPCETKWNARQPRLVMRGKASSVVVENDTAIIS